MRALIVGGDGMLGHVTKLHFQESGHEVRSTSRGDNADYKFDATTNLDDVKGDRHYILDAGCNVANRFAAFGKRS